MAVQTTLVNKPLNPRGNDQSPLAFNRAKLFSGKALAFDGVNDTLSTDYAPSSNIQTTAYWVKLDSLTTSYTLGGFVGSSDQFGLYYWGANANKNFGFNTWNGDSYGVTLPDFVDDYFHVVAEYNFTDFTQSKLFVNGQELGISQTHGTTQQRTTANRTFKIDSPSASTDEMNGKISGVKVFDVALTAAQVADLYNNPEKVVPTGVDNTALKLWLPMQEGAGTTAYDGSGNGNHGTISGATYTHGIGAPVSQTAVIDWNKGTNLLTQTEAIASNWSLSGGTWSSGQDDPFGGTNAAKITATSSDPYAYRNANNGIGGTQYTAKCWVKGDAGREARLWIIRDNVNFESEDFTLTGNWQEIETTKTFPTTPVSFVTFRLDVPNDTPGAGDVAYLFAPRLVAGDNADVYMPTLATDQTSPVLLPQGLTTGRDITGVNLFENVRKQGALNLDGNSWAEVHDNASVDLTTGLTLEAWVYWNPTSSSFGILGKYDTTTDKRAYLLFKSTTTKATFNISENGTGTSAGVNSVDLTSDEWYHIVGTYDGANVRIYTNGIESNSTPSSVTLNTTDTNLDIGRFNNDNEYPDQLAQPRIYNRALTAEEVQRNYNAGKNTYTNS